MLSGGIAALAGSVLVMRRGSVAALDFGVETSILLVAMVIIGGLGSLTGALAGAFLLFGLNPLLSEALGTASWVPYAVTFGSGIILILVLTRFRGGLAGLFYLPRDPVVQGMVWHDEESRAASDGHEERDLEATAAMPATKPSPRSRSRVRS
jgi:branched-chain amino acid transport system permease protein